MSRYDAAVDLFATKMKERLNTHLYKDAYDTPIDPGWLLKRILEELGETIQVSTQYIDSDTIFADDYTVILECADTANMLMFYAMAFGLERS